MVPSSVNQQKDVASASPPYGVADPMDFVALLKPRVMWLVVFTATAGLLASPVSMHPVLAVLTILCIAGGAGAAGCLNMWYEADIDSRMVRTQNRPLPSGKIGKPEALTFGVMVGGVSVLLLGLGISYVAAGLLVVTIFYYLVIYTVWLKPRTPQNVVIGGVAGALPPVVGWAATGASLYAPEPWVLFGVILLWTPPHSWALAIWKKSDYSAAGIPMLPSSGDSGVDSAGWWSVLYSGLLVALSLLVLIFGTFGWLTGGTLLACSWLMTVYSIKMRRAYLSNEQVGRRAAARLFKFSIWCLFSIFCSVIIDTVLLQ